MTCEEFSELVWSYPFEGMDETKIKEIEQHCSQCERCNKELQEVKELTIMLRALPEIEPPEDFTANIIEQIEAMPKIGRFQQIAAVCRKYYTAAAAACLAIVSLTAIDGDILNPKADDATASRIVITDASINTPVPEAGVPQVMMEDTGAIPTPHILPGSTDIPAEEQTTASVPQAGNTTKETRVTVRPTVRPQTAAPAETTRPVTQEATVQNQEAKEETPAPQITAGMAEQTAAPTAAVREDAAANVGIAVASIETNAAEANEEIPQTEIPLTVNEAQYVVDETALVTQTADAGSYSKMGEEPQKPERRAMPADKASKIAMIDIKDKDEGKVKLLLDQIDTTKEFGYYYLSADDYEAFISELKMENINHIRSIEMANPESDLVALQILVS